MTTSTVSPLLIGCSLTPTPMRLNVQSARTPQPIRWNNVQSARANKLSPLERQKTELNHFEDNNSVETFPSLSMIEVEKILKLKVPARHREIYQGFKNYDSEGKGFVTTGQFKRNLEVHGFPMVMEQLEAILNKIKKNSDGTVCYHDFLEKFSGPQNDINTWPSRPQSVCSNQSTPEFSLELLEKNLKEKIQSDCKNFVKYLRLYDFNHDGLILRKDLYKVIESQCFKIPEKQFDKLYQKYDFSHKGCLNYVQFLQQLGINLDSRKSFALQKDGSFQNGTNSLDASTMFSIEMDFRKKMQENYANLKRMFLIFDKQLDGYINLEDLRSVLNNFTMVMSDAVFIRLMERLGIKASGKISWENFLKKFQDPLSGHNGQTIPIKPSHKFFPVRGSDEKLDVDEILLLLNNRIKNGYDTLKKAFLQLDKNRDGNISRKELKELLENFSFKLSPEQFKGVVEFLDPQNTNTINYKIFLDIFEDRESATGHKWLDSCHKVNEHKSGTMAWSTIEKDIREKIDANRQNVLLAFVACDATGNGRVSQKKFRQILEKFSLPLSDEHFNNLLNRVGEVLDGSGVNYRNFFYEFGVDLEPKDSEGVSTEIYVNNQIDLAMHANDQEDRQEMIIQKMKDRTHQLQVDEVIVRLKDKMCQQSSDLRRAFLYYAQKHRNKITRNDFRKILEHFGFCFGDPEFDHLCSHLAFQNGKMSYTDFLVNFEDLRIGEKEPDLEKPPNHHFNAVRGDEYGMTAEEVEEKLHQKLRENFEDLRRAFHKFDEDHNGILTKKNFRQMLRTFMLIMTDDEFTKLCDRLGLSSTSRITYEDFLRMYQIQETRDGHKWLTSNHKFNSTKPIKSWSASEAYVSLGQKIHEKWRDQAEGFRLMDRNDKGFITKSDLREMLKGFMIPLNKTEFNILWAMFDKSGSGCVSRDEFLKRVTGHRGGRSGLSEQIIEGSKVADEQRLANLEERQVQNAMNQMDRVSIMSVDEILKYLRIVLKDRYPDFQTAFKTSDKRLKGFLTSSDIQNLLIQLGFALNDDKMFDLLDRLNLSMPKSRMTYEDFLKAFEEGGRDEFDKNDEEDVEYPQIRYDHLDPDQAVAKMKKRIVNKIDVILSACRSLDQQMSGFITTNDLRRILDNFCFKMADAQFKHFLKFVNIHSNNGENTIDYESCFEMIKDPNNNSTGKDLQEMVWKQIALSFSDVNQALVEIDFSGIGVVSKDDFRNVINKHAIRLSPEQFEKLWSGLPVTEFGNLNYKDLMTRISEIATPSTARPNTSNGIPRCSSVDVNRRPKTSESRCSSRILRSSMTSRSLDGSVRPFTPLVNAQDVEMKLKDKVVRHWKDIQRHCRNIDVNGTGMIGQENFKNLVTRYNLNLNEDDIFKMQLKYDIRNNNKFCYPDFIKHFVLDMNSAENTDGDVHALNSTRKSSRMKNGPDSNISKGAFDRIRQCLNGNFRKMMQEMRKLDVTLSGTVTSFELHQALRNCSIDLTEDEFCQVAEFFDVEGSDRIKYNNFIRYFVNPS